MLSSRIDPQSKTGFVGTGASHECVVRKFRFMASYACRVDLLILLLQRCRRAKPDITRRPSCVSQSVAARLHHNVHRAVIPHSKCALFLLFPIILGPLTITTSGKHDKRPPGRHTKNVASQTIRSGVIYVYPSCEEYRVYRWLK
jgi:hypothetical protein